MDLWRDAEVWQTVAAELRGHRRNGMGGHLTEDVVRFATVKALVAAGVPATQMRYEWPHPGLKGARVDLVIGQRPDVLVEFKFPREPNELNAAWTMMLGEILKDLYRLAVYEGAAERLFVLVESARLGRYLAGAGRRVGFDLDSDRVILAPARMAGLPETAARSLGGLATRGVSGRRTHLIAVDDDLRLAVYEIDPATADAGHAASVGDGDTTSPTDIPVAVFTRVHRGNNGVRREILDAVSDLLSRSGDSEFTLTDIVYEMRRRGSRYADSTVRTMVTSHMCANSPDHAATTYDDFIRVARGTYRLAGP